MKTNYRTIARPGSFEEEIRKSRFICDVERTDTEEEALLFIESIKTEHPKATHHCSAYLIGEHDAIQRANDDGEPSGTAGVPMLDVLKKNKVKNVTVVVTRYYGGVKLGAGGLIRAYGGAVSQALQKIGLVDRIYMQGIHLTVPYTLSGKIENDLRQSSYPLTDILYTDTVTFVCFAPMKDVKTFTDVFTNESNGQGMFEEKKTAFVDIPI